jgi:hypothetical protein
MMKGLCRCVAVVSILMLLGAAAYADEATPKGEASGGFLMPLNRKSAEYIYNLKEQRAQAAAAQKAQEENKLRKQERKAKADKLQRKTGRKASSWQVLHR